MKKVNLSKLFISPILTFSLISVNSAMADCKWSSDIKEVETGYLYSDDCHLRVGRLVQDEKDYKIEVKQLRKTIELKDLTIGDLKKDRNRWEDEAVEQFERFDKYKKAESKRTWLWFGLGVLATGAAVYGASHLNK